ncbi:MAG: DUF402 domain-containing protein [Lachnospiraceae bacterium]|nr:DUF402 domain-containing protein [Lachnospiraceae bacterium]
MSQPTLYRKRIIPDECIPLNDDEILYIDEKIIVTRWKTLHPKENFTHGLSCYFLDEGYKVSKFLNSCERLVYWYCDIVDYTYDKAEDTYVFRDLLVDVIVYPDDFVKVTDIDEFEQSIENGVLKTADVTGALKSLSKLLDIIYGGKFPLLTREIEKYT